MTEPNNRLDALHLRVRYRQRLSREWLFVEMAPEVRFDRFRDFNANLGFLLRFEIVFGKYQLDAVRKTPLDEKRDEELDEREGF